DVIWVGTGEGNPRNSHSSGGGIYKSLDAGKSWQLMGLVPTMNIHRIRINPHNPDEVFVGALGSIWGENKERGVFKTSDGGKTWDHSLAIDAGTGCSEMVMDPQNPDKLFAAMWEFGRKPWTFNSGGEGSGLYRTVNGGDQWVDLTGKGGLPDGPYGRIGLAISNSNPDVVYALIESKKTALYRSDDGGYNWEMTASENIGNRPFYYAEIYVHPTNENTVFNLYSMVSKSEDGGKNFEVILPYSGVHPDHHAFYIHPDNPDFMINGNDGGLNISRDGGEDWEFISNLPLGQFYHINYDMDIPYNIYGGMQDNGSWKAPGYVWHSNGIRNEDWQEISFGDGFDVVPVPGNPDEAYAMYQGGNVYKIHIPTGKMHYIQPLHPEGIPLRFNWNAAIAQDPYNSSSVYFGSQFVHKSDNMGQSWRVISPDLTTNDTTKQKQAMSGGLTIDATRAENYTTITTIAPSHHNSNVIWVGTDDGNVQLTQNGGESWTNLSGKIRSLRKGSWITQIVVGAKEGEAFVVANDYRRNHWKPYLLHTYDFGKTWENLVADVPNMAHCHAVAQDSKEPNLLFVGTDRGLYFSLDKGVNWQKWTNNYPSVPTVDLKIHPRESDLIIGTFGRAAYILDDIEPLRQMAKDGPGLLGKSIMMFDTHPAYHAEWKRAAGSRFQADHTWQGDNKRSGAVMSMYFAEDIIEEDAKASVEVKNAEGDLIRNWTFTPDTGIYRMRWNLRANGVRMPQLKTPDEDSDPPGGRLVAPGQYEVTVTYQDQSVSKSVQVLHDPRLDYDKDLF
ncbi:MAG: hypothetical protein HRT74_12100, partial [Flavobacteriales bacterium]|nr:hypothetical protein [Flavobacteriales bacterium]